MRCAVARGTYPGQPMQTDFVHAGQVRLQIFCQGSGPNLIVLVHGYRASGRVWRLVQESLNERRFRTIAINNVGAGDAHTRPLESERATFADSRLRPGRDWRMN